MKHLNAKKISLIIILLLSVFSINIGIGATVNLIKPVDLQKAEAAFKDKKFSIAAEYYESYVKSISETDSIALKNIAECYWQMRKTDSALDVYEHLYTNGKENVDLKIQQRIGELYARKKEYEKAAYWLDGIPGYEAKASIYSQNDKIENLKKESSRWNLFDLNLNTEYREFSPCLVDNVLFFSSNKVPKGTIKSNGWDGDNYTRPWQIPVSKIVSYPLNDVVYITPKKTVTKKVIRLADVYENGDNKSKNDNSRIITSTPTLKNDSSTKGNLVLNFDSKTYNVGNMVVDKHKHVYFSANYPKADKWGVNRIRLMEGMLSDNTMESYKELDFGDAKLYSVMHPAINDEGTIIVFASDKPTKNEGFDLYYATRASVDKKWGNAKAFSSSINTIGNEVFPSISNKGILYFSSDVLPGLGGLDIYKIPLEEAIEGKKEPEHLSYPINSSADDFGMTFDTTNVNGYFTSDRFNNNDNIFGFHYNAAVGQNLIAGTVLDKITMWPLEDATIFIWKKGTDTVIIAKTDEDGKYMVPIFKEGDYQIKAVKKEFSNDCVNMSASIQKASTDSIIAAPRNLVLENFQIGLKIQIDNIHYDFDKWSIRNEAKLILDSVVTVLNKYPINIELSAHTDSRGPMAYNEILSQKRAESAKNYLVEHGIETNRIKAKGYGERHLLNNCGNGVDCSAVEHQANRRTELKITGFTVKMPELEVNPDKFTNAEIISIKDLPENFFDSCK